MLLRGLEEQPPQSFISSRQEQQRRLKAPAAQLLLGLATETRGKRLRLHPKTLDKCVSQQDASVSAAAGGHQPDFHAAEMGAIPQIKAGMYPAEPAESWSHQAGRPQWSLGRPRRTPPLPDPNRSGRFQTQRCYANKQIKEETFGFDAASK